MRRHLEISERFGAVVGRNVALAHSGSACSVNYRPSFLPWFSLFENISTESNAEVVFVDHENCSCQSLQLFSYIGKDYVHLSMFPSSDIDFAQIFQNSNLNIATRRSTWASRTCHALLPIFKEWSGFLIYQKLVEEQDWNCMPFASLELWVATMGVAAIVKLQSSL